MFPGLAQLAVLAGAAVIAAESLLFHGQPGPATDAQARARVDLPLHRAVPGKAAGTGLLSR
jgi:hypothetical protein